MIWYEKTKCTQLEEVPLTEIDSSAKVEAWKTWCENRDRKQELSLAGSRVGPQ